MTFASIRKAVTLPSGKTAIINIDKEPEQLLDIVRLMPTADTVRLLSAYEIDLRVVNGQLVVESEAGEVSSEMYWHLRHRGEELEHMVILDQQDKQDSGIKGYNRPIRIFYANMLRIGIIIKVRNGQLRVSDSKGIMTPVIKDEIRKRAEHLIELLSPEVPTELEPFFHRLLKLDELQDAIRTAEIMGISLRTTPVDSGWLIEIMNHRVSKRPK